MRLLLFSDLHRDQAAAENLLEKAESADVMIGAGDFATCRNGIEDCIDILCQASCPAVLVPGNGESFEELQASCTGWPRGHVLHGTGVEIGGIDFFGIGGGIPVTPFGSWSWDFSEQDAEELISECPSGCVLISHSPPHGIADITSAGENKGSTAIREAIDRFSPRLIVCGHIHDSWEKHEQVGSTTVINAGPRGVWFDLH